MQNANSGRWQGNRKTVMCNLVCAEHKQRIRERVELKLLLHQRLEAFCRFAQVCVPHCDKYTLSADVKSLSIDQGPKYSFCQRNIAAAAHLHAGAPQLYARLKGDSASEAAGAVISRTTVPALPRTPCAASGSADCTSRRAHRTTLSPSCR